MDGELRNRGALSSGLGAESQDFVCIECGKGEVKAGSPGS